MNHVCNLHYLFYIGVYSCSELFLLYTVLVYGSRCSREKIMHKSGTTAEQSLNGSLPPCKYHKKNII